ncbi:MAG: helix-turn-helix domain-containing protein [Candidatus Thiodiazotropha sp. (ex Lucinoma kastoroae)]|nr:helix-turn-helix domain-containing protein [Candidatus Thiodiazotropha sp. (ex Lucinoma kastoroae)]
MPSNKPKKDLIERTIQVVMSMATPDLTPKNRDEIALHAGLPGSTTWRILKSLEKQGWAVHNPIEHTCIHELGLAGYHSLTEIARLCEARFGKARAPGKSTVGRYIRKISSKNHMPEME